MILCIQVIGGATSRQLTPVRVRATLDDRLVELKEQPRAPPAETPAFDFTSNEGVRDCAEWMAMAHVKHAFNTSTVTITAVDTEIRVKLRPAHHQKVRFCDTFGSDHILRFSGGWDTNWETEATAVCTSNEEAHRVAREICHLIYV
jgi:hypothetical protein